VKKYEKQKPADGSPSVRQSSVIAGAHNFPQAASIDAVSPGAWVGTLADLWGGGFRPLWKEYRQFYQNLYGGGLDSG
jgi:hypothetical protein